MSETALFLTVEEQRIASVLQEMSVRLDDTHDEAVLDFSSVRRINSQGIEALESLARIANEKAVKIVLRGITVDIYKVLKLVQLTSKVTFLH